MAPHSMVLCMVGTGLLWVGWYGFNAAARSRPMALLPTRSRPQHWPLPSVPSHGPCLSTRCAEDRASSGSVPVQSGLVVITPGCGYVSPTGAVVIGVAAGIVPFFACTKLKSMLGYDDALDTFGIHAVGGTLGAFLTGLFATAVLIQISP